MVICISRLKAFNYKSCILLGGAFDNASLIRFTKFVDEEFSTFKNDQNQKK